MENIFWKKFDNLITAFTTTRKDGFSEGEFASLNLGLHFGDNRQSVKKNRELVFENLPKDVVITAQSHSNTFAVVDQGDAGRGRNDFNDGIDADSLITSQKRLALGIYHADCVPVFVFVPSVGVVSIIHAGEKGSLSGIVKNTINEIKKRYKVDGEHIFAYLGPSLKFGHRLITEQKAIEIMKAYPNYASGVKATVPQYFLDLPVINFLQLRECGLPVNNIELYEGCVYEEEEKFYSYARNNVTGRNMSFIYLK